MIINSSFSTIANDYDDDVEATLLTGIVCELSEPRPQNSRTHHPQNI